MNFVFATVSDIDTYVFFTSEQHWNETNQLQTEFTKEEYKQLCKIAKTLDLYQVSDSIWCSECLFEQITQELSDFDNLRHDHSFQQFVTKEFPVVMMSVGY